MSKSVVLALSIASLAAFLPVAQAAPPCAARDKVIENLGQRYHENRKALGLAQELAVVEVFVSAAGTWTITVTNTHGLTCVIAAGDAWQSDSKHLAGLDS
jgi:hypothetical protein